MYLYGALSSTSAVTPTAKQDDLVLVNSVNYLKTKENVNKSLSQSITQFFLYIFYFPLKDDENLLQLEQYLENEKQTNDMIQGLSKIGGLDGQDFLKRVKSMVLSNELAKQYS
ncbi:hypothetical protein FQA39_LY13415 [Lamprigera yunnana]|nr:hypothetical protein FQA39_LY13415 [Lamprigera yunnana]